VLIIASVVFRSAIKEPLPEPEQPPHEGEDESIWDNTFGIAEKGFNKN